MAISIILQFFRVEQDIGTKSKKELKSGNEKNIIAHAPSNKSHISGVFQASGLWL